MRIPIAHDFICPWCWIGLFQVKQLSEEFPVEFDWIGYELFPIELPWPPSGTPAPPTNTNKPTTPRRTDLAYAAQGMNRPKNRGNPNTRSHAAHEAVEYAKTEGDPLPLIEAIYRAYWEQAADIEDEAVILEIGKPFVKDFEALSQAVLTKRFADKIIGFDDAAYASGVYNVPTFWIGDKRYAEEPTMVLRQAIKEALES